jgi:hypothetical protein
MFSCIFFFSFFFFSFFFFFFFFFNDRSSLLYIFFQAPLFSFLMLIANICLLVLLSYDEVSLCLVDAQVVLNPALVSPFHV